MYFVAIDVLTERNIATKKHGADEGGGRIVINPFAALYVFGIIWDMFLILLMINEMREHFLKTRLIFCQGIFLKSMLSTANCDMDQRVSP